MNLYKIEFLHAAPKDIERGLKCLLIAENDESVYNWIKSEPEINGSSLFNSWADNELLKYNPDDGVFVDEDGDESDEYFTDENGNPIDFKTKMLSIKGELNDEDYDFADAFYGITLFGWSLLKENVNTDYSELIDLGIIFKA